MSDDRPVVLLIGNPNAGKTTVFNRLSGARARVGNYPGITVERKTADLPLPGGRTAELVDLPGTYSLTARSPEEQVAVDAVLARHGARRDAVVVVADATTLERALYLLLQVAEADTPVVLALNMMDDAARDGIRIDHRRLGRELGVEVVPIVAARGEGIEALTAAIERTLRGRTTPKIEVPLPSPLTADLAELASVVAEDLPGVTPGTERAWAAWCLMSVGGDELTEIPPRVRAAVRRIHRHADDARRDLDRELIGARYAVVDRLGDAVIRRAERPRRSMTDRIDAVLTHRGWGLATFGLVMFGLFEALFSWADPLMGVVETGITVAQGAVEGAMGPGMLRDLLVDGVIQGVGNVVVFVPQIALLFAFIAILEDSGYLARVAFVIDPIMARLGLHGRAFVPLLSGFACAVPAVLATRTIESRRHRLITMLSLPMMSCSARLPVYVLVIGTVFVGQPRLFGVLSVGALALLAMYVLSVAMTLAAAAVLGRTVFAGPRPALVLELPTYRMPVFGSVLGSTWRRVKDFLREAGTVILGLTVVLWALLSMPGSARVAAEHEAAVAEITATTEPGSERDDRIAQAERDTATAQLRHSVAGRFAVATEPALEPLGFDWRIGVAIFGSFAAREVFVSTLGMVMAVEETDDAQPLRQALGRARRPDGTRLMTPLVGVSLMVFFVLACQCMSTIAVVARESGSWRWPAIMFGYMSALAYGCSLLVYQTGSFFGWGTS